MCANYCYEILIDEAISVIVKYIDVDLEVVSSKVKT